MVVFECAKCRETFHDDGLHIIIHELSAGRVCPACLANAERITVVLERSAPGKPYELTYTAVELSENSDES